MATRPGDIQGKRPAAIDSTNGQERDGVVKRAKTYKDRREGIAAVDRLRERLDARRADGNLELGAKAVESRVESLELRAKVHKVFNREAASDA